jgi:hypothetical protein
MYVQEGNQGTFVIFLAPNAQKRFMRDISLLRGVVVRIQTKEGCRHLLIPKWKILLVLQ